MEETTDYLVGMRGQLRRASLLSLGLWFAVVLAGAVLPNVV